MATASSSDTLCGPCDARHLTVAAPVYCTSCDEGLCDSCLDHHKVLKATRNHQTVPVNNYTGIGSLLSSVKQECEKHGRKFDFYCKDHKTPCCVSCVTESHKQCLGLKPIDDLANELKSSTVLEDIECGIQNLRQSLEGLRTVNNIESLQMQKSTVQEKIKTFRKKIEKHLDKIESNLLCELDSFFNETKGKMEKLHVELEKKEKEINQLQNCIKAIKEIPGSIQSYLASKAIEIKLNMENKWTIDICNPEDRGKMSLDVNINNKLEGIITEVESFGKISVNDSPYPVQVDEWKHKEAAVQVNEWKHKEAAVQVDEWKHKEAAVQVDEWKLTELQAQLHVQPLSRDIRNTKLLHILEIKFNKGCYINDGCLLPDGRIVFVDHENNQLLLNDQNGKLVKTVKVNKWPNAVTMIDTNTVAVSACSSVQIIDIDRGVVKKTIDTNNECSGISYYNGHLYVMLRYKGIGQYDMDGNLIRTIQVGEPFGGYGHICVVSTGVCYTFRNYVSSNLFTARCDLSGNRKWWSKIGNAGVAIDETGNVFVANNISHDLYYVSADRRQEKCLLSEDNGLYEPKGVDYYRKNNTLLVITKKRTPNIYKLHSYE